MLPSAEEIQGMPMLDLHAAARNRQSQAGP
jgi:hypothetical protein